MFKLLTAGNNAGGLTPNMAKRIIYEARGEVSEDYPDGWGDMPLAYYNTQNSGFDISSLNMSLQKQIEKAAGNHDDAVVAVMKEVKRLLLKMDKDEDSESWITVNGTHVYLDSDGNSDMGPADLTDGSGSDSGDSGSSSDIRSK